jgi:cytochrome c-type biogenesis protein CcmF
MDMPSLDEVMDLPDPPPPPVRAILCLIGSPEDDHEGQLELSAVYVILGSFVDLGRRLFGGGVSADMVSQRARGLPRHAFGTAFAHAGLSVTLLGLAATGWGAEKITALKPGEAVEIGPYELTFESVVPRDGPNYSELAGHTLIRSKGALVATIEPATRFYPARRMNRSEAGIATLGLGQVYMSIADVAARTG